MSQQSNASQPGMPTPSSGPTSACVPDAFVASPLVASAFIASAFIASAFMERLIRLLMPFFIATAIDTDTARGDILETLNAYGARTRAEMLSAARIIAFSMATLDTLAESNAADLSPTMKLRHRSCANGLNRATIQTEKALDQSLAREIPLQADAGSEPINDASDAETQATIDHAKAAIQAHRDRVARPRPAAIQETAQQNGQVRQNPPNQDQARHGQATQHQTQPDRNKLLWAGAMRDTLRQMGISDAPPSAG